MTLSQVTHRFASFLGAVAISWLLIFVGPVSAANAASPNGPYFQVELTEAASVEKNMVRGVFVNCAGTSCQAPKANSSHKGFCAQVAREFGEVSSFSAGKRVFDGEQLAKCNGKSKLKVAKK